MATFLFYDHTISKLLSGDFSTSDTYKVLLLDADGITAFDPAHTTLSAVTDAGSYEVYGNGWPQGGVEIPNVSQATYDTAEQIFDGDDISVPITGGALGPFSGFVIFNNTDANAPPIGIVILDSPQTIGENYMAVIEWPLTGFLWFKRGL